jgi:hypothetical protein
MIPVLMTQELLQSLAKHAHRNQPPKECMNTIRMQMITQLTGEAIGTLKGPVTAETQAKVIESAIEALTLALELVRGATTMPRRAADAKAKEALAAIGKESPERQKWSMSEWAAAHASPASAFDFNSFGVMKGPDGIVFNAWHGGDQPEDTQGKMVKVIFRCNPHMVSESAPADGLRWSTGISSSDIIGYRVL